MDEPLTAGDGVRRASASLAADVVAGVSMAGLLLPEAVAYAGIAGLPPQAGVLALFAGLAPAWPDARLVVANSGSLREALEHRAGTLGLAERIDFVGRIDADAQSAWYDRAGWYLSVPRSDSVSVSVLEAMAHGCIPLLSDLPANRELVHDGANGLILPDTQSALVPATLERLQSRAVAIAGANRDWIAANALFGPCVDAFVARLEQRTPTPGMPA